MSVRNLQLNVSSQPTQEVRTVVTIEGAASAATRNVPVAVKAPAKLSFVKMSPGTISDQLPGIDDSTVGTNTPSVLEEAKIQLDRPEPVTIFTQRTTDFTGGPNSSFYAAAYQTYIESRIADAFVAELFRKATTADPAFFENQDKIANDNIAASQSIISTIDGVLAKIRKFNDTLAPSGLLRAGESLRAKMIEKLELVGAPEPLLAESPLVKGLFDVVVEEYETAYEEIVSEFQRSHGSSLNPHERVFPIKAPSDFIAMNASIVQEYFRRGTTLRLAGQTAAASTFVVPGENLSLSHSQRYKPFTFPKALYQTQVSLSAQQDSIESKGTPFDNNNEIEDGAKLGFYANQHVFKELRGATPLDAAVSLITILANEMCFSAGFGRLKGSQLATQFGLEAGFESFINNILGADSTDVFGEGLRPRGSMLDFLVVDPEGNVTSPVGRDRSAVKRTIANHTLLFENKASVTRIPGDVPRKSATTTFAETVLRDTANNNMQAYDDAITASLNMANKTLEIYKKLHARDQPVDLLTPRGLFTRVLEEIAVSLDATANGFEGMDQAVVGELALFTKCGEEDPSTGVTTPAISRTRALLYTTICRIVFSIQQNKSSTLVVGKSSPSEPPDKNKTEVKVKRGNETDTFTVETTDLSAELTEDIDLEIDATNPRFSGSDVDNFVKPGKLPEESLIGAIIAGDATEKFDTDDLFQVGALSVLTNAESNTGSLTYRIAQLFVDMCEEAKLIASADGGENGFLTADRTTNAHRLDAGTLVAMIFEAACKIASVFFSCRLVKSNGYVPLGDFQIEGKNDPNDFRGIIEEFYLRTAMNDPGLTTETHKAIIATVAETGFIYAAGDFSAGGPNDISRKAISALIAASKADSFSGVINVDPSGEDQLPGVDNKSTAVTITPHSGQRAYSFTALEQIIVDLARERDLPYNALLAYFAHIQAIVGATQELKDLGLRLAGNKEQNDESAALRQFAQTELGKTFLASVTDRQLVIAHEKLKRIEKQNSLPARRIERLSLGELIAVRLLASELENLPGQTVMFVNVGLPISFTEETLLPTFAIESGRNTEGQTMAVTINAFDSVGVADLSGVQYNFLVRNIIDQDSFNDVAKLSKLSNFRALVESVIIKGTAETPNISGDQFISNATDREFARELLTNEIKSYLIKKVYSTMSASDLVPASMKARSTTARATQTVRLAAEAGTLAAPLAAIAGLPNDIFNSALLGPENPGHGDDFTYSVIDQRKLLDLLYPTTTSTPTGQVTTQAQLDFATAELFNDAFSSLPFNATTILEQVFEPTPYERIMCCVASPTDFVPVSDDSTTGLSGGVAVETDVEYAADFAISEKTPGTFILNTYDVTVTPGERIIQR